MTVRNLLLSAVMAVLFLLSALSAQSLLLKNEDVLVMLGDSITEGGEWPQGYVSLMRKALDALYPEMRVYIVNSGIGGHKSTDMNDRFQRDVLQYRPTWVTISVGVNDVWHGFYDNHPQGDGPRGVPLATYKDKVIDMVRRAQQQNARVALFTCTVIKENLDSPENQKLLLYNQAVREIARKYKCILVDQDAACRQVLQPLQKPGMADRGVLTNDGVHMLASGNWLMARTCLTALGVPEERLNAVKPFVDQMATEDQESLKKSFSRYEEQNFELGKPRENEKRIIFFGSSSVERWKLRKDFPTTTIYNRGIGGETSRSMWLRFRQDVLELNPYAVIIFFGSGNDFWPKNKMCTAHTLANLGRMVRMAQAKGIQVAVGAIMPVNDYEAGKDFISTHPLETVRQLNRQIKEFCASQQLAYIDFYTPVADHSGRLAKEYSDDGMHCNEKGYAAWKQPVEEILKLWNIN
jgi:acyl-CoA thioesterase I